MSGTAATIGNNGAKRITVMMVTMTASDQQRATA